jgi:hypothetical protein
VLYHFYLRFIKAFLVTELLLIFISSFSGVMTACLSILCLSLHVYFIRLTFVFYIVNVLLHPEFTSRQGLGLFILSVSSPALGPTQPPLQWVPGALSPWVKRPGSEADRSPSSRAEVNNTWS